MVLSEHEIRTAKLLRISSHDRAGDSQSHYLFKCYTKDYFINQVRKCCIKSISIPNTQYNVSTTNNIFTYDIGAGDVAIPIPVGQYGNLGDVLDALTTAVLNGPDALVMTYTLDAFTLKATLTFNVPVIIRRGDNGNDTTEVGVSTLSHVIGAGDSDTASLTVHVMPDLPDLSGLKKIYIASNTLTVSSSMVSTNGVQANVISECNIEVPFGFYQHRLIDEIETQDESTSTVPNNFGATIDIQILDEKLRPVDLNGHDVYLTVKLFM